MKPTEEQIKEFWEWCGIKQSPCRWYCPFSPDPKEDMWEKKPHTHCEYPDGKVELTTGGEYYPPIDLNNLFKYAVPKLYTNDTLESIEFYHGSMVSLYFHETAYSEARTVNGNNQDPALALFWAIWEVIHE